MFYYRIQSGKIDKVSYPGIVEILHDLNGDKWVVCYPGTIVGADWNSVTMEDYLSYKMANFPEPIEEVVE